VLGRRIHVTGNSCAGKSTLGARLAERLSLPFVELDALNWEPGWVGLHEADPEELTRRIEDATAGDEWVVAGSYSRFSKPLLWPRLETAIWLDLPRLTLARRALVRSWRRWRSKELLWRTNREKFFPQLKIWSKRDSLIPWIIGQHEEKRHFMIEGMADPRWEHIRFIRLRSSREIEELVRDVMA